MRQPCWEAASRFGRDHGAEALRKDELSALPLRCLPMASPARRRPVPLVRRTVFHLYNTGGNSSFAAVSSVEARSDVAGAVSVAITKDV